MANYGDSAISPSDASDTQNDDVELPVDIDLITIDATQPEVGDMVDLKVGGKITRLVNGVAYVKPDTINNQPMPKTPLEPNPQVSEMDRLEQLSQTSGGMNDDY